jgi:hypothetical protein
VHYRNGVRFAAALARVGSSKDKAVRDTPKPVATDPLTNDQRSADVQRGREAKHRFDKWQPTNLVVSEHLNSGDSCPLHACHEEHGITFTVDIPPIDLEGHPTFPLAPSLYSLVWPTPFAPRRVPVRYGKIAKGYLTLERDDQNRVWSTGWALLPMFHPALPPRSSSEEPALAVFVEAGAVYGEIARSSTQSSMSAPGPSPIRWLLVDDAANLARLDDLQKLKVGRYINVLFDGHLSFELDDLAFELDGMFPGRGKYSIDTAQPLSASADVEAEGVAKQSIPIERDDDGQLTASSDLGLDLSPEKLPGDEWSGRLSARFSRGKFDIRGTADYRSKSGQVAGTATLLLTDVQSAWAATRQRLGAHAPVREPETKTAMALIGWGALEFHLSEWLDGTLEAVVDPAGYITTRGVLTPKKEYTLFDRKKIDGAIPGTNIEIPHLPLLGEVLHIEGGFAFHANGSLGPGTVRDIVATGVYSTNPDIQTELDIAATIAVPAEGHLKLSIWGGIALGEGPISAGIDLKITGSADLSAYGEARPHIVRRRKAGAHDGSAEYVIHGAMEIAAALDAALEGTIELHALTVKLASVKLFGHTWRLANFGVRADFNHVIGSKTPPTLSFEEVPFNDYKFMKAAVENGTEHGQAHDTPDHASFTDAPVRGALPAAHVPTLGPADTKPPPETAAAGQIPSIADEPVPPLSPNAPPPEETTTFDMEGTDHTLWLAFDDPPTVFMASPLPREQLSKRLAVALAEVKDEIATANANNASPRSVKDLQLEHDALDALVNDCLRVELNAARLGVHPGDRLPGSVPGFRELGRAIHAYGEEYDRDDLISSAAAKAAPQYRGRQRPAPLTGKLTPNLDALERIEPGVTERYVSEYQDYLVNGGEQDLVVYIDGRAARKLGRTVEPEMLDRYESKFGVTNTKIPFDVGDPVTDAIRNRVPDIFVDGYSVGDVKDVIEQSNDAQMRDDQLIAAGGELVRRTGATKTELTRNLRFDLIVRRASHLRPKTHVTGPLQDAIEHSGGRLLYWIPDHNEK